MIKIFPTRFIMENDIPLEQLWEWLSGKIHGSSITKIVPLEMERNTLSGQIVIKGLIEVHCSENVSTRELEQLLKPHPAFLHQIFFTFQ